jgi:hypothetical protein
MRAFLLAAAALLSPAAACAQAEPGPPLTELELAQVTGKFLLPNGVELALSITSDTVVNGQAVLRTVLTLDQGQQVKVFGRDGSAPGAAYPAGTPAAPMAVAVSLDRRSGLGTITPVIVAPGGGTSVNAPTPDAHALGLTLLPLAAGGPAVATADGLVSLAAVRGGTQVTLAGDQYGVAHVVGDTVATALVNSGNNRTFDNVTNVAIDLKGALPYQSGAAALRVDALALEATGRMMR